MNRAATIVVPDDDVHARPGGGRRLQPYVGPLPSPVRPASVLTAAPYDRRPQALAALRIVFGLVWTVDAWFKWQPAFANGLTGYLTDAKDGQPQLVKDWLQPWIKIVGVNPHLFAHLVALGETAVAIGLLFGLFSRTTYAVGALLAVTIWSTAEGLGGPYTTGSTDIGAGIIYVFVFAALWIGSAGATWSIDHRLTQRHRRALHSPTSAAS